MAMISVRTGINDKEQIDDLIDVLELGLQSAFTCSNCEICEHTKICKEVSRVLHYLHTKRTTCENINKR